MMSALPLAQFEAVSSWRPGLVVPLGGALHPEIVAGSLHSPSSFLPEAPQLSKQEPKQDTRELSVLFIHVTI